MSTTTSSVGGIFCGLSATPTAHGPHTIGGTGTTVMNFYIAHSEPHQRWADAIRCELAAGLENGMPHVKFGIHSLVLSGSSNDCMNTLMRHEVLSGHSKEPGYTFVITPGWWESEVVHYARAANMLRVPQLFCLPSSPAELFRQAAQEEEDRTLLGGVYAWPTAPQKYIDNLSALRKGAVKKVCIAYNTEDGTAHMRKIMRYQVCELRDAFLKEGIAVELHRWTFDSMGYDRLLGLMKTCDAAVTLHEPTAELYYKELVRICERYGKVVCASSLDGLYDGAVLGLGVRGSAFGRPLLGLIAHYLINPSRGLNWETYCIPEQRGAHINDHAREAQGVHFTREEEALFRARSLYDPDQTEY